VRKGGKRGWCALAAADTPTTPLFLSSALAASTHGMRHTLAGLAHVARSAEAALALRALRPRARAGLAGGLAFSLFAPPRLAHARLPVAVALLIAVAVESVALAWRASRAALPLADAAWKGAAAVALAACARALVVDADPAAASVARAEAAAAACARAAAACAAALGGGARTPPPLPPPSTAPCESGLRPGARRSARVAGRGRARGRGDDE